ncbi:MAG: hypothetical protein AMXMBFR84_00440 [Candidatus Hydrogenedentota bacterium]
MSKPKTISKPKSLFIKELETPPALAVTQVTTLALGEEGDSSFPISLPVLEYLKGKAV